MLHIQKFKKWGGQRFKLKESGARWKFKYSRKYLLKYFPFFKGLNGFLKKKKKVKIAHFFLVLNNIPL